MKLAIIASEAERAIRIAVQQDHPVSNLEQLGVSQRLINLLQANGINNMKDLMLKKKEDLLKIDHFGKRQLEILFDAFSKYHMVENSY
jgi:DNA-directed RNA polymerase alpha subunit